MILMIERVRFDMADKKYYAIQSEKNHGVYYETWNEFQPKVKGVSGVIYKSFTKKEDADAFVKANGYEQTPIESDVFGTVAANGNAAEIYVDGSYNKVKNAYGYGVFIMENNNARILSGSGECEEAGRNIEGEVAGARAAIDYIKNNTDIKKLVIYHDYEGIKRWGDKEWRTNKGYTAAYSKFVEDARMSGLSIEFIHVKGHSGHLGNEYVDRIAKIACGIDLTKDDKKLLEELRDVEGFPDIDDVSLDDRKDESFSKDDVSLYGILN